DRLLIACRGLHRAELTIRADDHSDAARYGLAVDACYKGGVLRALFANADLTGVARCPRRADVDVIAAGSEINPGLITDRHVVGPGRVIEQSPETETGIIPAGGRLESLRARRGVEVAGLVGKQGVDSEGGVVAARRVRTKCV